MSRIKANQAIVNIVADYIKNNPNMRFIQALWALGIINQKNDCLIEDRFNEESEETLNKLEKLGAK